MTSDLVRLYIDGRDIRPDLGGSKVTPSSSITTTPKKYIDVTENSSVAEDMSNLVVKIIENVNDLKNKDGDMKEIVAEIVAEAVSKQEEKTLDEGRGIVSDGVVSKIGLQEEGETSKDVKEILSDVLNDVAKTNESYKEMLPTEVDNETVVSGNAATAEISKGSVEDCTNEAGSGQTVDVKTGIKEDLNEIVNKVTKDSGKGVEEKPSGCETKDVIREVTEDSSETKGVKESNESTPATLKAVANTLNDIIETATAGNKYRKQ